VIWGKWERKYFSEKQKNDSTALSTNNPTGKITALRESQIPLASRTRCSALRAAPQSRDLYCHLLPCEVDPGAAAHRCGAAQHPGNGRNRHEASRLGLSFTVDREQSHKSILLSHIVIVGPDAFMSVPAVPRMLRSAQRCAADRVTSQGNKWQYRSRLCGAARRALHRVRDASGICSRRSCSDCPSGCLLTGCRVIFLFFRKKYFPFPLTPNYI